MLDKTFEPAAVEWRCYALWEASGAFAADPGRAQPPYTIMMPPPNVTGSLHMGHALTFTLQDVLVRYQRLRGRDVLWQPGTDHAGIATEIVVTNQLAERQIDKRALGRDKFVERVWEWKAEFGGTIVNQLRRLGCSPDWTRQRFTMDPALAAAVRRVFVQLYREGLVYRDQRLVNWDPQMHTAISDLEVDSRESQRLSVAHPLSDRGRAGPFIVVATTRPETMLGDTAVAVHPDDPRYADLVGKSVRLPLVGRLIPIIADEYADPETGSGAVKITPAHDFNDFAVGKRHDLPMINIFDADARLNYAAPAGLSRSGPVRGVQKIVADLDLAGLLDKVKRTPDGAASRPLGRRHRAVADRPMVLRCPRAGRAGDRRGREWGYAVCAAAMGEHLFEWMRNIQPWCISRQMWGGTRSRPAWAGWHVVVAERRRGTRRASEIRAHGRSASRRGRARHLVFVRLVAVLDLGVAREGTWSVRLRYYPGDVLVTGFDIIFFWVARMMMMGLHFRGEVPFRAVYIHALVATSAARRC